MTKRGGAVELLRIPAWAFGLAAGLRTGCYDSGLLSAHRVPAPVFSVGNLSVGGTGKTPLVVWLARELARRGRRAGIVSRGYRARPGEPNDEGQMLAAALPDVLQVQDADRVRGAQALIARGADALVLDDGFQHRRLARDVDVVLVDALRPWGLSRDAGGASVRSLLPRGLLRESPRALARADALVVTRADQVSAAWLEELERELELFAPGVPRILARHAPRALVHADGRREGLEALAGREVELVSGIGNPEAFARTVRDLGARVAGERRFQDHHAFAPGDLDGLGGGGRLILCTAKDRAKLAALGAACASLEVELEFRSHAGALGALIDAALDAAVPAARQTRKS